MKKGFYNLILIAFISIIVFLIGFYYFWYDNYKYNNHYDVPIKISALVNKNYSTSNVQVIQLLSEKHIDFQ